MSVGGLGRHPGVRRGPRAAVPARRRGADRRAGPRRLEPRRDDAPGRPAPRRAARPRRHGRRGRPATHGHGRPGRRVPAARPRHGPGARARAAARGGGRWTRRRGVRRASYPGLRGGPRGGDVVVARAGRAGHRGRGRGGPLARPAARGGRPGHRADRPRRGAARHRQRHRPRLGQPRPRARAVRHAVRRLRLPDRAGQRPGGTRARAEGRPAAGLPLDRGPGGSGARRAGLGRRAGLPSRQGEVGLRAARRARHPGRCPGAARARLQHRGLRTERLVRLVAARRSGPAGRRGLRDVRDRGPCRRGAAGDPVGRGDRHDDQPRGPRGAAPPGRLTARGCAQRPRGAGGPRSAARVRRADARRAGRGVRPSCGGRRPAGRPTTRVSPTRRSPSAAGCSGRAPPVRQGLPGCSSTGSPTPTAGPGSCR